MFDAIDGSKTKTPNYVAALQALAETYHTSFAAYFSQYRVADFFPTDETTQRDIAYWAATPLSATVSYREKISQFNIGFKAGQYEIGQASAQIVGFKDSDDQPAWALTNLRFHFNSREHQLPGLGSYFHYALVGHALKAEHDPTQTAWLACTGTLVNDKSRDYFRDLGFTSVEVDNALLPLTNPIPWQPAQGLRAEWQALQGLLVPTKVTQLTVILRGQPKLISVARLSATDACRVMQTGLRRYILQKTCKLPIPFAG